MGHTSTSPRETQSKVWVPGALLAATLPHTLPPCRRHVQSCTSVLTRGRAGRARFSDYRGTRRDQKGPEGVRHELAQGGQIRVEQRQHIAPFTEPRPHMGPSGTECVCVGGCTPGAQDHHHHTAVVYLPGKLCDQRPDQRSHSCIEPENSTRQPILLIPCFAGDPDDRHHARQCRTDDRKVHKTCFIWFQKYIYPVWHRKVSLFL